MCHVDVGAGRDAVFVCSMLMWMLAMTPCVHIDVGAVHVDVGAVHVDVGAVHVDVGASRDAVCAMLMWVLAVTPCVPC